MASNNPFEGIVNLLQATLAQDQVANKLQSITEQLADLKVASDNASRAGAVSEAQSSATALSGSGILESLGGFLGGGLGLFPLVSGLASLFGNDDNASEPIVSVARYAAPASLRANAGFSDSVADTFGVDSAQGGLARAVSLAPAQVVVNVSAMDSKSFLDHSDDIARAVRQAMLESAVLTDVIREA